MPLAPAGKRMVAHALFDKGKAFILASLLLEEKKVSKFVVLHLLCQGMEIILKSLLLHRDFDKFWPQQRRMRHDLVAVTEEVRQAFGARMISKEIADELALLSQLYSTHKLRYAGVHDIFGGSDGIAYENVKRKALQLTVFGQKLFSQPLPQYK